MFSMGYNKVIFEALTNEHDENKEKLRCDEIGRCSTLSVM